MPALLALAPAGAAPGDWDTGFRSEVPGRMQTAALQGDGRILVMAPSAEPIDSWPPLRRLRPDGRRDFSFNPEVDLSGASSGLRVDLILEQPDGKILVSGEFPYARGNAAKGLTRLQASGREDDTFRLAGDFPVLGLLALQPDRKLIAYSRSTVNGPDFWGDEFTLTRLLPNGEVDASFQPSWPGRKLVSLPLVRLTESGQLLVAGEFFRTDAGIQEPRFLRLEVSGAIDPAFNAVLRDASAGEPPLIPLALAEQADGKILVGGYSPVPAASPLRDLMRLHADGSVDEAFQPETVGTVFSIHVQADGRLLIRDDQTNPPFIRLLADGSRDPTFNALVMHPQSGARPELLAVQNDGALIINGARPGEETRGPDIFGRLLNSPATSVVHVIEGSTLRWERGGSAPEVDWVIFEARPSGRTEWTPLGAGARVPGGWLLADATLPERGSVRARGFTGHSSTGPAEEHLAFGGASPVLAVEFPAGTSLASGTGVVDCGETWLHRSRAIPVVLRNSGDVDLRGFSFTVRGPHAGDFTVVPTPETSLPPQAIGTFLVVFQPSAVGPRTATLAITGAGVADGPFVVTLTGKAGRSLSPTFVTPNHIPARAEDFTVPGRSLGEVTLLFEPQPGLSLTVADNVPASASLIDAAQAAPITARFGQATYQFQADYHQLFAGGLTLRLVAPGAPDIRVRRDPHGRSVRALAAQADGRLLVGEETTWFDNQPRTRLARHFADGAPDPTFAPELPGSVEAMAVQADARILVAGAFSVQGGPTNPQIVRLLPSGLLDPSFAPSGVFPSVAALLVQPDGRILVGGREWVDGIGWRAVLIRLFPDGTIDPAFSPSIATTSQTGDGASSVACLSRQSDGNILVGGRFDTVNGVPRTGLVRLLPDGRLDAGFNVANLQQVGALGLLTDGRILAAGAAGGRHLLRLQPNGDWDTGFLQTAHAPRGVDAIRRIAVQADGKILLAGDFTTLYGSDELDQYQCNGVVRLLADGAIDHSYKTDRLFESPGIVDLVIQRDGSIWTGASVEPPLARLFNDAVSSPLEVTSPSTLLWRHTGAQEECARAEFAVFDAVTSSWSPLGAATRVAAGWELAGAALPASGAVRVRGFLGNGSHGVTEEWLSLGNAAPVLVVENAEGMPLPSGTAVATFPPAPLWKPPQVLTLRLRNAGPGAMAPPAVALTGPQASAFEVLNSPTTAIGPQESQDLVLTFDPSGASLHTAELELSYPGQTGVAYTVTLQGMGVTTLSPHFDSPSVGVEVQPEFRLEGVTFGTLTLGFVPDPGLVLTVLNQTKDRQYEGPAFDPMMAGLPQEGAAVAHYQGQTFVFRANYEGGEDRQDLTLTLVGPGMPETVFGSARPGPGPQLEVGLALFNASVAADQSIMVQGDFVLNSFRHEARIFRADGTPSPLAFPLNPPAADNSILAHSLEDGGWLAGRSIPPPSAPNRAGIMRVTRDGAISADYLQNFNTEILTSSFLMPDGRLLMTGSFRSDDHIPIGQSVRLTQEGRRDASFQSDTTTLFYWKSAILGLPDGSIITGQRYIDGGELPVNRLVRLLTHGVRDPSFAISVTDASGLSYVDCLARQADGKILVGGTFDHVGGRPRSYLARLHMDGRLDESFAPALATNVNSIALQTDGKIIVAGGNAYSGDERLPTLIRLLPDGSRDPTFVASCNSTVRGVTLQANGRLLAIGPFTHVNNFRRYSHVRLLNDPATESLTVPDADTVRWLRGGSAPETQDVWFDVTTDAGATWSRLGIGSRIEGGWQLGGLELPSAGHVRARARVVGGYRNASSSLVESVAVFGREATALEGWRTLHFGSPLSQNEGQDSADPDHDRLANRLEYALGFDPHADNAAQAPQWTETGEHWELRVTQSPAAAGVACFAEWSPDLRPDSWQPLENLGSQAELLFRVPIPSPAGPARYVRWGVLPAMDP
ncbi:MAG: choice-of-anchor D domain-containing protein [Verrucomicrobiales bacterium]